MSLNILLMTAFGGVVSTIIALFVGTMRGAKRERVNRDQAELRARETAFKVGQKVDDMTADERRERLKKWAGR